MFDLLLTLVVIYLAYRIFYKKNTFLNRAPGRSPLRDQTNQQENDRDEGEYIDYEEVDD